jgi:hypothetical protein
MSETYDTRKTRITSNLCNCKAWRKENTEAAPACNGKLFSQRSGFETTADTASTLPLLLPRQQATPCPRPDQMH